MNPYFKDEYDVPMWKMNHDIFPLFFEVHSREDVFITYHAICKYFLEKNMTKPEGTGYFEHRLYWTLDINLSKTLIVKCDKHEQSLENCSIKFRKYQFYHHRIILFQCPKPLPQDFSKNTSKVFLNLPPKITFFISFRYFFSFFWLKL